MAMLRIAAMILRRLSIFQKQDLTIKKQICPSRILEFGSSYTTDATPDTPGVIYIKKLLKNRFPLARNIEVVDISGGCGEMYEIFVESVEFKGLTVVKQHRLVNDTLKEEIKQMHGLRIDTAIPPGTDE